MGLGRIGSTLYETGADVLKVTVQTGVGVVGMALTIATFRQIGLFESAANQLESSKLLLSRAYIGVADTITDGTADEVLNNQHNKKHESFLYGRFVMELQEKAFSERTCSSIVKFRLAAVAVRVSDLALIPITLVGVIIMPKNCTKNLHIHMFRQLKGLGFLNDLLSLFRDLQDPSAFREINNIPGVSRTAGDEGGEFYAI